MFCPTMVNYLGCYLPNLSEVCKPLNDLLQSDVEWYWGHNQDKAFSAVKDLVTKTPVLAYYDASRPTRISADASSYGIGGVILQQSDNCWRPVAFCSRTLTCAEQRYAQIEKECLASVWACERFAQYVCGLPSFELLSDHKPLIPLINSKDLDLVPLRCQRLLLRLMRFNPVARHVPGKELVIADTLSRHPQVVRTVSELELEVEAHVDAITSSWPASETMLSRLRQASLDDTLIRDALQYTKEGWPRYKTDLCFPMYKYWEVRGELSHVDGLLTYGSRIVVPQLLRSEILDRIHDGHQGVSKCRARAKASVWWPGLSVDVETRVSKCTHCAEYRATQHKEPLVTTQLPARPWQMVGADLCYHRGQNYLIVIDYFSHYLEVMHLASTTSRNVIAKLKCCFARHGVPAEFRSDNGPQFSSMEFKKFSLNYEFHHSTSDPHFPQSNGEAEKGVDIAKRILNQEDPFRGLLAYRSTPIAATGYSPAELLMGRKLRTPLPVLNHNLDPKWPVFKRVHHQDEKTKSAYKYHYDRRHGARPLPVLKGGDPVLVKLDKERGWTKPATIVGQIIQGFTDLG